MKGKLYLSYDENVIESRSHTSISWKPLGVYAKHPDLIYVEELEADPAWDKVAILVARYTSGSTFGKSFGHWYIVGTFKSWAEARDKYREVLAPGYRGHKPWEGYFETLKGFEIHVFDVDRDTDLAQYTVDLKTYIH